MSALGRVGLAMERHPGRVIAGVGALFAAAYLVAMVVGRPPHGRIVGGDGVHYYVYLRSLLFDGDVDFTNDYALLGAQPVRIAPTGRPANVMAIGPGLLWTPFIVAVLAAATALRALGFDAPVDGVAAPYQIAAGLAGIAYATAGVWLCFRCARRVAGERAALWAALTAWLAASALYYSLVAPAYSHATSLFAAALFFERWAATRGDEALGRFALLGALGGLAALVRWQDGVILLVVLVETADAVRRGHCTLGAAALRLTILGAAFVVAVSPQLFAWQAIYGRPLLIPQGGGFMHWSKPRLGAVLLGADRGLFVWTPALGVAALGLLGLARRDRGLGVAAAAVLLASIYVNAATADPGSGEAFGGRRFIGDTVIFALGFAAAFAALEKRAGAAAVRAASLALVGLNFLLLVQYQAMMHGLRELSPYPVTYRQVLLDRFVVPWRLVRHALGGSSR